MEAFLDGKINSSRVAYYDVIRETMVSMKSISDFFAVYLRFCDPWNRYYYTFFVSCCSARFLDVTIIAVHVIYCNGVVSRDFICCLCINLYRLPVRLQNVSEVFQSPLPRET